MTAAFPEELSSRFDMSSPQTALPKDAGRADGVRYLKQRNGRTQAQTCPIYYYFIGTFIPKFDNIAECSTLPETLMPIKPTYTTRWTRSLGCLKIGLLGGSV
ncbi:hypothetical protein [Mesorhizobium sp. M0159]|uniref:hypothetical protein n=1 Tax=Mesorhizobium sp. M0159 TaxID=2956900 RepID=UPI0033381EE3